MHGGVILFRGSGTDARRYLESDRSRADDYYLEGGTALAEFVAVDGRGEVVGELGLTAGEYAQWVDWVNPLTGESMGIPRLPGNGRRGSPRFAEMVVNVPKSLSVAAALHPEVSDALDAAQRDAVAEIRSWLGQHSVTRVGPRGRQEVAPVEQLETVAVSHKTSRAGDPHRHIHFQIGTRVWAAGAWRGLDTGALFKQQGAIRALGTAVLAAHPQLAAVLDAHGLTLDPVTGEVIELQPFNPVMSKRGAQVGRNLAMFEAQWEEAHPGEEPGPVVRARLLAKAWDHERPSKKPSTLGSEAGWLRELQDAGYTPDLPRAAAPRVRSLDDLAVQGIASRALDRCAAAASTWTVHDIQEQATRLTTEAGVRATPAELREFVRITTRLAAEDCLSVLPPDAPTPQHVAHLTSLHVVAVETELRDRLQHLADASNDAATPVVRDAQLDEEQSQAAAAIASTAPLVVVEGAAGAGKTTMLGAAIHAAGREGRPVRVVTPTKKAAAVAAQELGVPANSVAALVYAHGYRWNADGVWSRLTPGETDPETDAVYRGPSEDARLAAGERVVVDEAGMLDQDTALALLTIIQESGATLALVGDRAQLAAVGRGGVLDIAAQLTPGRVEMTGVRRFTDPEYAQLTLELREARNPALIFNRLQALGLIRLHDDEDTLRDAIAGQHQDGVAVTVATNDEARELNERIRAQRVRDGAVDDTRIAFGSDGLPIGGGDLIQTRRNDAEIGVTNRQTFTVQHAGDDGTLWVTNSADRRKHHRTIRLPAEYVAEHSHLAYAATGYGAQGVTAPASHTILSEAMDAAGVYVGLTRGREANVLHLVAADAEDAREQFTTALVRDRSDRGLEKATQQAATAVAGLTDDGPVKTVNAERGRLVTLIEHADQHARKLEQALAELTRQAQAHQAKAEAQQDVVQAAETHAEHALAEAMAPLIREAAGDGTALLAARERMWAAAQAQRGARGRRGRAAARALAQASEQAQAAETSVREHWGEVPQSRDAIPAWAQQAARQTAETAPAVVHARKQLTEAQVARRDLTARQMHERATLRRQLLADHTPSTVRQAVQRLQQQAEAARADLARIEALPPGEAVEFIRARVQQEQACREAVLALAERQARTTAPTPPPQNPGTSERGLGR
ncbi:MobF family relaxase [Gryllotalpicola reticulitermitis]|uniref:MobF family relaxase n=1 Tax=Gryllotalpicola reticulitermitis TaxID=1184153 RepID=A0ABV8Q8M2_9MICO